MLPYVQPASLSPNWLSAVSFVMGVVALQLNNVGRDVGVCAARSLSATSKILLQGSVPLLVAGVMLVLGVGYYALALMPCGSRRTSRNSSLIQLPSRQLLSAVPSTMYDFDDDDGEHYVLDERRMSSAARWIAAFLAVALLAYNTILSAAVQLLFCVPVPGQPTASSFLFVDGTVRCNFQGAQAASAVVLAVLVLIPVAVLPWVSSRAQAGNVEQATPTPAHRRDGLCVQGSDWHDGFCRAVVGIYSVHCYWWESVLMCQRLLLALLYAFLPQSPAVQALLSALSVLAFLLLHMHVQPMRSDASTLSFLTQHFQSLLLVCLLVVSMCRVYTATQSQFARAVASDASDAMFNTLAGLFGYGIPIAAGVYCLLFRRFRVDHE